MLHSAWQGHFSTIGRELVVMNCRMASALILQPFALRMITHFLSWYCEMSWEENGPCE